MHLPLSKADKSTALTHISADAEAISAAINRMPGTFIAPFYLAVALYALYRLAGKVMVLAIPPCLRKYHPYQLPLCANLTDY